MRISVLFLLALIGASAAFAQSEFTIYDLLPPETHKFAIMYDVSTSEPGTKFYLNPIRPGSKVSGESKNRGSRCVTQGNMYTQLPLGIV